jgi:hypothetical protein
VSMFDPSTPAVIPTDANGYISLPVTVDYASLYNAAFQFVAAQIPGWTPAEGDLDTWIIEACALMVSTQATVAAQMPLSAFAYFGGYLLGVPPLTGAAAQTATTWTMVDTQGYTIPAGTVVEFATSGNTTTLFTTTLDFTVPTGQSATASGAVTVAASVIGSAANGIASGTMQLVDSLSYVSGVVSTEVTSGGADAETQSGYLNRLSNQLQLLTPRPVLAADFALLAVNQPDVYRAVGIDNYDPYMNLLLAAGASFETGTGSWVTGANTTIGQSTVWAADGTHSLSLTATASGSATATNQYFPFVSAGESMSAMTLFHAGTTGRNCTIGIQWFDIHHTLLSTTTGSTVVDSTSGGIQATATGVAPAGTNSAGLIVTVAGCVASEVHYIDEAGLFLGASVTTWSAGGMTTAQRAITVVPVDVNGNALTVSDMNSLQSYLSGMRETNFLVAVVPPSYYAITVSVAVVAVPFADIDAVTAAVEAALSAYLSPATWAGGGNTPPTWLLDTTVYYLNVGSVIGAVAGVHHVVAGSLTLNGGTSDIAMPGIATLPVAAINVTCTSAAPNT